MAARARILARARAAALPTAPSHQLSKQAHQSQGPERSTLWLLPPEFPANMRTARRPIYCTFARSLPCVRTERPSRHQAQLLETSPSRDLNDGQAKTGSHRCFSAGKTQRSQEVLSWEVSGDRYRKTPQGAIGRDSHARSGRSLHAGGALVRSLAEPNEVALGSTRPGRRVVISCSNQTLPSGSLNEAREE